MPSSMRSAHAQTCLQTAPETFECLAAALQLACLEEAHACGAPEQRQVAESLAKAGMVNSDHPQLAELLCWWHAVARSADADTVTRMETVVEAARRPEVVEAEAGGIARLDDALQSVGAEGVEHSWRDRTQTLVSSRMLDLRVTANGVKRANSQADEEQPAGVSQCRTQALRHATRFTQQNSQ